MDWRNYSVIAIGDFQELPRATMAQLSRIILHGKSQHSATLLAHPGDRFGVDSDGSSHLLLQYDLLEARPVREVAQETRQSAADQLQAKVRRDTFHCRAFVRPTSTSVHHARLHPVQHAAELGDESSRRFISSPLVHLTLLDLPRLCADSGDLRCDQRKLSASFSTDEIV